MQLLLDHIVPLSLMTVFIIACYVCEALLRRKLPAKPKLTYIPLLLAVLAGAGMFVYLLSIGADTELILPVILLLMFISMVI